MDIQHLSTEDLDRYNETFNWEDVSLSHKPGLQTVTGNSLVHGNCVQFAGLLSGFLHEAGYDCRTESYKLTPVTTAHTYCVIDYKDHNIYVDVRGAFYDYSDFMDEFVKYEKNVHNRDIDVNNNHNIEDAHRDYGTVRDFFDDLTAVLDDKGGEADIETAMYLGKEILDDNCNIFIDGIEDCKHVINRKVRLDRLLKKAEAECSPVYDQEPKGFQLEGI